MTKAALAVVVYCALGAALPSGVGAQGKDKEKFGEARLDEKNWPTLLAPPQVKVDAKDDAETKLLKERYEAGQKELRERYTYWLQPTGVTLPEVYEAAKRAVEARLEMEGPRADKVAILKEKVAFAKSVEKQANGLAQQFRTARYAADVLSAKYFRANAELELLRAEKAAQEKQNK